MIQDFDNHFRDWVSAACQDWGYPMPPETYFITAYARLPAGLRSLLNYGLKSGFIIPQGKTFMLSGLKSGKGPYKWFSQNNSTKEPRINWEYFVQVAEYVRFHTLTVSKDIQVTFEDHLMDIGIYQNDKLFVCCEVKEKVDQIKKLISKLRTYESGVDLSEPDRGNDSLRKAKYIVQQKPAYFEGIAIGIRLEYKVIYSGDKSFHLQEDIVPLL